MESTESSTHKSFDNQYNTYLSELEGVFPEFKNEILEAKKISRDEQLNFFGSWFYGHSGNLKEESKPDYILPGIKISQELWLTLSNNTRCAILEYMRILGMCAFFEKGLSSTEGDGHRPDWAERATQDWQKYMTHGLENLDLGRFTDFFKSFFENLKVDNHKEEEEDNKTANNFFKKFPKIPEKFLKGHMAKFAEELVRDINPEELGFTPELIAEIESSPSRAFDILISMLTKNPQFLQGTIQKIGRKLQAKIQSGAINPAEIAREAEEMIKDFADNPEMIELMESMKSIFGMEDMGLARKAGKEGSARLAAVRARLHKKMEAKNMNTTANGVGVGVGGLSNIVESPASLDELIKTIENTEKEKKEKSSKLNKNTKTATKKKL